MKSILCNFSVLFLILLAVGNASAQQPETIRMYDLDHSIRIKAKAPAYEINRNYIRLAPQIATGGLLTEDDLLMLPMNEGVVEYRIDRISRYSENTYSVIARSMDNSEMLTYTVQDGHIRGNLHMHERGQLYQLKYDPVLSENYMAILDYGKLDILACPGHEVPYVVKNIDALVRDKVKQKEIAFVDEQNVFIDLLILYSTQAGQWMDDFGGGADLFIAEALNRAQLALDNSEVFITYRLAHAAETAFDEASAGNDTREILHMLEEYGDGYMDEAYVLRDSSNADMVALLAYINDYGGLANLNIIPQGAPNTAFSVIRVQQMDFTPVFAHELGHNLGNAHSRNQIGEPADEIGGLHEYSTGWRWAGTDGEGYASVMTYPDGDQNVPYFSNPDILYMGVPTGSYSGEFAPADNARSMNEIRAVVANYDVVLDLFTGGSGSEEDPYQISNAAALDAMRYFIDGHFILINDIDLGFDTGNSGGQFWNEGKGWEPVHQPIEYLLITFQGALNGNDHVINNLFINRPESGNIGLFGSTGTAASIINVDLENVNITGSDEVGGLIGLNIGTVTNSYTAGVINSQKNSGGLVGDNSIGGTPGEIIGSYSTVDVTCAFRCGGLAGQNSGTIINSYSTGSVTGNSEVGGLVGQNREDTIRDGTITNSYSVGKVEAESYFGGLVGVVENNAAIHNSYWNVETSGIASSEYGIGLTTAQMLQKSSFTGWDFDETWTNIENETYPSLKANMQSPLPAPLFLMAPANNSESALPVIFEWEEFNGAASYQLQIAQDSTFETMAVDSTGIEALSVEVANLLNDTIYYWQVRAQNASGSWSEVWSFTTEPEDEPISLVAPANNSESALPVIFEWEEFNGAASYQLQIAQDSTFETMAVDSTGIEALSVEVANLLNDTIYYWQVRAQNASGSWSEVWSFTTIMEVPVVPELIHPEDHVEISDSVRLAWNRSERAESYTVHVSESDTFNELFLSASEVEEDFIEFSLPKEDKTYFWRVKAVNSGGESNWSDTLNFSTKLPVSVEREFLPNVFSLKQNYPNPFNPVTHIVFDVPIASHINIEVFNLVGQKVATVVQKQFNAGSYKVAFDAASLSSGVYIYRLQAGSYVETKKMTLIK